MQLYSLLGDLPAIDRSIRVLSQTVSQEDHRIVERLSLDLNGEEPVPALFLRPKHSAKPLPCVLYNHSHGGFFDRGKEELSQGAPYLYSKSYADSFLEAGYCVLAIDGWCFGERQGRSQSSVAKEMLWKGQTLWEWMVFDSLKAIDYLRQRPDVDPARIGTLGMSMGSTIAWWIAALDPRIQACVDICCLTDFHSLIEADGLDEHALYYYIPSLLQHFTTAEINALICPRPHLALAGLKDPLTPVKGLERIDACLKEHYSRHDASHAWKLSTFDVAHQETKAMREETMSFLKTWLS